MWCSRWSTLSGGSGHYGPYWVSNSLVCWISTTVVVGFRSWHPHRNNIRSAGGQLIKFSPSLSLSLSLFLSFISYIHIIIILYYYLHLFLYLYFTFDGLIGIICSTFRNVGSLSERQVMSSSMANGKRPIRRRVGTDAGCRAHFNWSQLFNSDTWWHTWRDWVGPQRRCWLSIDYQLIIR